MYGPMAGIPSKAFFRHTERCRPWHRIVGTHQAGAFDTWMTLQVGEIALHGREGVIGDQQLLQWSLHCCCRLPVCCPSASASACGHLVRRQTFQPTCLSFKMCLRGRQLSSIRQDGLQGRLQTGRTNMRRMLVYMTVLSRAWIAQRSFLFCFCWVVV